MKKYLSMMLAVAMLLAAVSACAEPANPTYAAVYGADNPVPAIAEAVRPAVVQIVCKQILWDKESGEHSVEMGYGSGVYFDERGYVLTNYHVVENADEYELIFLDGAKLPAALVGGDSGIDVAVLKFEGAVDAHPVPFGDSDALKIGELSIAIGNPGSGREVLFGTVTAGVISGLDREDMNAGNFSRSVKVIQTDAAINTGNSGGALLNAKGELIGIPTLKIMFNFDTVFEGLGFAIPINAAKPVIAQLIDSGKMVRPRLGITVLNIEGPDRPLRNYAPGGVQVQAVEPGAPASLAGVMPYDIILEIDGLRVTNYNQLTAQVDTHTAGEKVALKICRYFNPNSGEPLEKWEMLDLEVAVEMID